MQDANVLLYKKSFHKGKSVLAFASESPQTALSS